MTEDKFWEIIEQSRAGHDGSHDAQADALTSVLSGMSVEDVVAFDRIFTELRFRAYNNDLWGAAYIINGGCSDDGFEYFRCNLIGSGRDRYEKALLDPESLVEWASDDAEENEFEGLMYVANEVYQAKTGTSAFIKHQNLEHPGLSGEEWSEEDGDLDRRFPKLTARFISGL